MAYTVWIIIAVICIVIEALFPGLFIFLPLALACSATAIMSCMWQSLVIDIITLLTSLTATLFMFQFWSHRTRPEYHTNVYSIIGQTGYVISPIFPEHKGYVHIDDGEWRAAAHTHLEIGTRIEVRDVRGCHVIVQKHATQEGG